jgi:ribosomal protein S18 acetylase RimI-like enzyme
MPHFSIVRADVTAVHDGDLEDLLRRVYVLGGFTDPSLAATMFRATDVRARGELLIARDAVGRLIGMVVAVFPGSPACRLASGREAELHLLAVSPGHQRLGVGAALVNAALDTARTAGAHRMILWTQPTMTAARRLYVKQGFERLPELDFSRADRHFQVYARSLEG